MTKWVTKKLGEIASLQGGFAFQSKDFADDGIPLIRIGDITAKGLNTNNSAKLPSYFLDEHTEFALKADDTIIAMSGATVGKCTLVTEKDIPALLNQRVGRFKVKNCIDKKFVYYTVSNYSYQQKLLLDAIGGAQPNVSPRQIESVLCPIPIKADGTPDLAEQKRIAGILSSADGAIAASEALIEKYRNIKRGLLATLLQPKEGWKKVKLGECLTRLCNGLTYDVEEKSGYMVTRIETISNDDIDYNRVGHIRTLPKQEYRIQKGDILFSHINSVKHIGKVAYFDDEQELYHGMNLLLMRFHESCDSKFFFYMLSSEKVRKRMRSLAKSAVNQASINTTELHNFTISYPESLAEQHRIAEILSSVDAKIAAEEKVVEKYKGVKKGLMEEFMKY